jgi:ribonuclease-3
MQYNGKLIISQYKRSLIIRKDRVEQWSLVYGLPERLQVHRSQELVIRGNQNARVQVFQAYVGALFREKGYDFVKEWFEYVVEAALTDILA